MRLRLLLLGAISIAAFAQTLPDIYGGESHGDPPFLYQNGWRPLLNGKDLSGWKPATGPTNDWFTSRAVRWKRIFSPTRLTASPAPGDRIVNGPAGKAANLITEEKFGDAELYLEFMLVKGSNSGIYVQGLYEIQIFDSYGYTGHLQVGDCGGVYGRNGSDTGSPPRQNAARAPGEWQSLHIWFRAPRFDAAGKKVENARFLRVMLNDILVQENFEVVAPTLGRLEFPEAAMNPIMLQGDHGPVAYRNIYVRPLGEK